MLIYKAGEKNAIATLRELKSNKLKFSLLFNQTSRYNFGTHNVIP